MLADFLSASGALQSSRRDGCVRILVGTDMVLMDRRIRVVRDTIRDIGD